VLPTPTHLAILLRGRRPRWSSDPVG